METTTPPQPTVTATPAASQATPINQSGRRWMYGTSVAVAILAAITIVIMVNWIGHKWFWRFDLTSTGKYTLSPQTRKVLDNLQGDFRIVTLLSPPEKNPDPRFVQAVRQVNDLSDEYAAYSKHVTAEHIDPDLNPARADAFKQQVRDQFKADLEPAQKAIDEGKAVLAKLRSNAAPVLALVDAVIKSKDVDKEMIDQIAGYRTMLTTVSSQKEIEEANKALTASTAETLPDYSTLAGKLSSMLKSLSSRVYTEPAKVFKALGESQQIPASARESMLRLAEALQKVADNPDIAKAIAALDAVKIPPDYERARSGVEQSQAIVIVGPKREPSRDGTTRSNIQVYGLGDMISFSDDPIDPNEPKHDEQFLGDDRLSGALMSLNIQNPPLVVFCLSAAGQEQDFSIVQKLLREKAFEVTTWNPSPAMNPNNPMQEPPANRTPPEPKPGQKVVWVVLPSVVDRRTGMPAPDDQIAQHIKKRLDAGDSALLFAYSEGGMGMMGVPQTPSTAIPKLAEPFGISVDTSHVLARMIPARNNQAHAVAQMDVSDWTDHPIGKALAGLTGVAVNMRPLTLAKDNANAKPLATVSGPNIWATTEVTKDSKRPDGPPETFTVAAAGEKDKARVLVLADAVWATDQAVAYCVLGGQLVPPQAVESNGLPVFYPANREFVTNGVLWLANMDHLLAASGRTQDTRRIGEVSKGGLTALQWGLPTGLTLLVLGLGVGVYFLRRAG